MAEGIATVMPPGSTGATLFGEEGVVEEEGFNHYKNDLKRLATYPVG